MGSIILSFFTTQHDAMEIKVTYHPWSLKITILGTKWVSRKLGAYHSSTGSAVGNSNCALAALIMPIINKDDFNTTPSDQYKYFFLIAMHFY